MLYNTISNESTTGHPTKALTFMIIMTTSRVIPNMKSQSLIEKSIKSETMILI